MKEPGFQLNYHNRTENVPFEAHDPSMMWDEASGMYYSYCTDSAITSEYRQGIPVRKSADLVEFTFVGYALSEKAVQEASDNGKYPPTKGFWAPFAEYVNGEYRLYYSATKAFGSSESRIWLAVSGSPEGPFENRGVVMDTWETTDALPNAIDPHVTETGDGKRYLIYGSFFGGIYAKELDAVSGLAKSKDSRELGVRIAKKPENSYIDGPEGAAVLYHKEKDRFYLFLSYGWLGDDYDIRVGVSRQITGPYVDREGKSLDGVSLGQKLAGSYRFQAEKPYARLQGADSSPEWQFGGFRGPGHGVPFYDEKNQRYFFVHHVRDGAECFCHKPKRPGEKASYRMHYMMLRAMYFPEEFPVLMPEPYVGETEAVSLTAEEIKEQRKKAVRFEWLLLKNKENEQAESIEEALPEELTEGMAGIGCDFENGGTCLQMAAYTKKNEMLWAKAFF